MHHTDSKYSLSIPAMLCDFIRKATGCWDHDTRSTQSPLMSTFAGIGNFTKRVSAKLLLAFMNHDFLKSASATPRTLYGLNILITDM